MSQNSGSRNFITNRVMVFSILRHSHIGEQCPARIWSDRWRLNGQLLHHCVDMRWKCLLLMVFMRLGFGLKINTWDSWSEMDIMGYMNFNLISLIIFHNGLHSDLGCCHNCSMYPPLTIHGHSLIASLGARGFWPLSLWASGGLWPRTWSVPFHCPAALLCSWAGISGNSCAWADRHQVCCGWIVPVCS